MCMHTAHVCLCRQHRAGGCGEHADADLALSGRRRRRAGQGAGGRPRALKVHHALALLFSRLSLAPLAAAGRAGSGQAAASIHSALEARSPSCPRTLARASTVKTGQQRRGVPRAFSDNRVALDESMGGAQACAPDLNSCVDFVYSKALKNPDGLVVPFAPTCPAGPCSNGRQPCSGAPTGPSRSLKCSQPPRGGPSLSSSLEWVSGSAGARFTGRRPSRPSRPPASSSSQGKRRTRAPAGTRQKRPARTQAGLTIGMLGRASTSTSGHGLRIPAR